MKVGFTFKILIFLRTFWIFRIADTVIMRATKLKLNVTATGTMKAKIRARRWAIQQYSAPEPVRAYSLLQSARCIQQLLFNFGFHSKSVMSRHVLCR